jgi:hypothetical protein
LGSARVLWTFFVRFAASVSREQHGLDFPLHMHPENSTYKLHSDDGDGSPCRSCLVWSAAARCSCRMIVGPE